jgi:hypothetical protein
VRASACSTNTSELRNDFVHYLVVDAQGGLAIATEGGLVIMRDGKWRRDDAADGLTAERLAGLAEDRDGSLWVGSNHGLFHFRDGRFVHYGTAEGLPDERLFRSHLRRDRAVRIARPTWLAWPRDARAASAPAAKTAAAADRAIAAGPRSLPP